MPTYDPITNEFNVGRRLSNAYGTIAMAKLGGNTNSATSQWFINLANNTFLDAATEPNLTYLGPELDLSVVRFTLTLGVLWRLSGQTGGSAVFGWGIGFGL